MTFTQPHRIWQPLAFVLALLLLAAPAQASVQDVRVLASARDRSSSVAAALALDYAKKRAVYLVARKMQVEDAGRKISALKPAQWDEIIRGTSVLQTKREGEVTYADVTVTVVNEALRRALEVAEPEASTIRESEAMRGVMVLPVTIGKTRPYLWEPENRMAEPLRSEVLRQARGSVIVPSGDFDDRRLVDYQNALDVTADQLGPMYDRYGIDEVIIAVVTLGTPDTDEETKILLRRLGRPPAVSRVESMSLNPERMQESGPVRVEKAARAIAAAATQIAAATSQRQQALLKGAPNLPIAFRYATARDLATMQQAVREAPGVLQLVMPAIALQDMKGVLYLTGKREDVRQTLLKQGFVVTDEGDGWILSVR